MKNTLLNWHKIAIKQTQSNLGIANIMRAPKLEKVVINVGVRDAVSNSKAVPSAIDLLSSITGQKPISTKAKKSIAGFKIREGMPIGACVTLRGVKMYNFLYKLINLALPKIRDFQGLKKKMDGRGNYNLGLSSVDLFPEGERLGIVESHMGLCITIVTSAEKDEEAYMLLKNLGMPFIR